MLIQNIKQDILHLVHNETVYKVVKGITDVPKEVRDELTKFPEWHDFVGEVDDEIKTLFEKDDDSDNDHDKNDGDGENPDSEPTVADLRTQAKELGITGAARMKKEDLQAAIEEAKSKE